MTQWTSDNIRVATNIIAIAYKYKKIPPVLMLAVCLQEDSLNENAVNIADAPDYGGSIGIFQLNQDPRAHPGTIEVATNPWYDYGYPEIRTSWEAAFSTLGGWSAFLSDPQGFLASFAPLAQESIAWSRELATVRLQSACNLMSIIEG